MAASYFGTFRDKPYPTLYGPNQTAVTYDKLVLGLLVGVGVLAFTLLIVSPAIRGTKTLTYFLKVGASLFVGCVIVVSNYGYEWHSGTLETRTAYKAFSDHEITAAVGLHIGLRGINITLKGQPEHQLNEQIEYNERFSWGWQQLRIGFGPYANQLNREFRDAQWRGMPLPILWIAEYFTLDGENIRWNRGYRQAGFYTHIMLWAAFGMWFIANFLFLFAPRAGYYIWGLIGIILLASVIIYSGVIHKWPELKIPFRDGTLKLTYGWSFWLVVVSGMFCVISSLGLFVLDRLWPLQFVSLFDLTVGQDYTSMVHDSNDRRTLSKVSQRRRTVRLSKNRQLQVKPIQSDENDCIYDNEDILSGKTSTMTESGVEVQVFVVPSSTDP